MNTYKVFFTNAEGEATVEFMEFKTNNTLSATRMAAKLVKKQYGGLVLNCELYIAD